MPRFPSWAAALGPGVVGMALAQGNGALVWWPYLVAKYGLTFLWLLVPACLLPYPLTVEIGRYTLLTGETIVRGLDRVHPWLGGVLWILTTLSFLWFGALASAGGTALAALTQFPGGFTVRGRSLLWAYASVAVVVGAIACSGVVYRRIERCTKVVAVVTIAGLLWACAQPGVRPVLPAFLAAFTGSPGPSERAWDVNDAPALLTAVAFAGLGGFWILLYAHWLRDKGSGMAAHGGRITGLVTRNAEPTVAGGHLIDDTAVSAAEWPRWRRWLAVDAAIGVLANLATTAMTCLLAYALLYPRGLLPEDYEIAARQSAFFEVGWGPIGRVLLLLIAAAVLADAWLVAADGVSRMHADFVYQRFARARGLGLRRLYYLALAVLTAVTCLTMLLGAPVALLPLSAVLGFTGTLVVPPAIFVLNYRRLAPALPPWARPRALAALPLAVSFLAYALLAAAYAWAAWPW